MNSTVIVYRAQKVWQTVPDLSITTVEELPNLIATRTDALAEGMAIFRRQAKEIADALYTSLPGGTLDQLLREMLERKASHFFVPFGQTRHDVETCGVDKCPRCADYYAQIAKDKGTR